MIVLMKGGIFDFLFLERDAELGIAVHERLLFVGVQLANFTQLSSKAECALISLYGIKHEMVHNLSW